jgi:mono/diheme cytochrome c family protein
MMKLSIATAKWAIAVFALPILALAVWSPPRSQATNTMAYSDQAVFNSKCAMCHGTDGSGNTAVGKNMKLRDLRSAEVQKQSDAQLRAIIGKGKNKMPGFEKSLGADQVNQLVAHVRAMGKKS